MIKELKACANCGTKVWLYNGYTLCYDCQKVANRKTLSQFAKDKARRIEEMWGTK